MSSPIEPSPNYVWVWFLALANGKKRSFSYGTVLCESIDIETLLEMEVHSV